jgi:hypothetical protein
MDLILLSTRRVLHDHVKHCPLTTVFGADLPFNYHSFLSSLVVAGV